MEELLKKILSQDPTLLTRRDELIKILDEQVPGKLAREYNSIKRALMLNIGEIFATGNDNREAAISKATEILAQSGLQENRVKSVIDTFIKVLDWDKEPAQVEEVKETAKVEDAAPAWMDAEETTPPAPTVEEIFKKATPPPSPPKNPTPLRITPPPVNPPPAPPTNFSNSTPAPQSSNTSKFIIAGLVVVILFLIVGRGDDNSNSQKTSTTKQESYTEETTATPAPQPQKPALVASSELSLNGVDIGLPFDTVWDYFGTPDSIKNEDGYERYYYSDIEVVFRNGYLNAFVTRSPNYQTSRGISVGSSYSEVVDRYGRNSSNMEYNGLQLHEYRFNSIRGESGLLRFAVNPSNNRVDYISIRIDEPEPVARTQNNIPANVEQAARVFLLYHQSITNGNFPQAYDLMTYDRQQVMGPYGSFIQGYRDTISSEITELNLISDNGNSVTFSYTLESRDRTSSSRVLYRTFVGEVQMVKSGGDWKINNVRSSKTGESLR